MVVHFILDLVVVVTTSAIFTLQLTRKVQNITLLDGPHLILLTQASTYVFTLDRVTDTERNFLLTVNRQCSRQRSSLMWLRLSNKAI